LESILVYLLEKYDNLEKNLIELIAKYYR